MTDEDFESIKKRSKEFVELTRHLTRPSNEFEHQLAWDLMVLIFEVERLKHAIDDLGLCVEEMSEALRDVLTNAALDWYGKKFKETNQKPWESGVLVEVFNRDLEQRMLKKFERARVVLKKWVGK